MAMLRGGFAVFGGWWLCDMLRACVRTGSRNTQTGAAAGHIHAPAAQAHTMAENLDALGQQFTDYYYKAFDADRSQLTPLYVGLYIG